MTRFSRGIFLSTLSLRRATGKNNGHDTASNISIHALLAESDAPQGCYTLWEVTFLSTLSLRRATRRKQPNFGGHIHFYPRSPCGERRHEKIQNASTCLFLSTLSLRRATSGYFRFPRLDAISIHALLAESDLLEQSASYNTYLISIHALLAESDTIPRGGHISKANFYPRSPCGERPRFGSYSQCTH